ncbi:hypothetical protein HWD99_17425 [Microbacterium sp. C5A9]|uniref:AvrD family protein n=1 Tax=Microbacterium sp. C5A9 TaxID=2736663 RepID=UPI001F52862D|nr:AvrD family protein [Microbacterium sp. C5A9]MCI1020410.1 hypothetical protein [Microbacterium sp. C5A9]
MAGVASSVSVDEPRSGGERRWEELLGPARDRYFAGRYRETEYAFVSGSSSGDLTYSVHLSQQPTEWHLTSIDAVVLARYAIMDTSPPDLTRWLRRSWVQSLDLRAGRQPTTDLERVRVTAQLQASSHQVTIDADVGTMHVRLGVAADEPVPACGGEVAEPVPQRSLRESPTAVPSVIEFSDQRVNAEWHFDSGLTAIDYIATFGQLTQAIAYHHAGLRRKDAEMLWMRRIEMAGIPAPGHGRTHLRSFAQLTRDRGHRTARGVVHDVHVAAHATTGVWAKASAAYIEREAR